MQASEKSELLSFKNDHHQHFRVAAFGENKCTLASYNRRDFYKVTLVINCNSDLLYADREIVIDRPALVFVNPQVPYSWTTQKDNEPVAGFYCVFTEDFLQADRMIGSIQESALFRPGGNPVFLLDDDQLAYLSGIFSRMRKEADSEYIYKYDIIRSS